MRFDDIKWKVEPCGVGKKCWCRTIVTVNNEDVIDAGRIDNDFAKYVVKLHNQYIKGIQARVTL